MTRTAGAIGTLAPGGAVCPSPLWATIRAAGPGKAVAVKVPAMTFVPSAKTARTSTLSAAAAFVPSVHQFCALPLPSVLVASAKTLPPPLVTR